MMILVHIYSKGIGVEQNEISAFKWCLQAAEAGEVIAMRIVSQIYRKMHESKKGKEEDLDSALEWERKAKEREQERLKKSDSRKSAPPSKQPQSPNIAPRKAPVLTD